MTLLALLSTLTTSGWVLLAVVIAFTLEFLLVLVARREPSDTDAAGCLAVGAVWAWLLWLLTPGGAL